MHTAAEALRIAGGFGIPGQNLLVGDAEGHIGWTIAGRLPRHSDAAPVVPQLSTDPIVGFEGWLSPGEQPQVLDPAEGCSGRRTRGSSAATPRASSAMTGWIVAPEQRRFMQTCAPRRSRWNPWPACGSSSMTARCFSSAGGHSSARSSSGRLRRATISGRHATCSRAGAVTRQRMILPIGLTSEFREEVEARVFYMLVAPARHKAGDFDFEIPASFEGPLWRLVEARPPHLLANAYASWDALLAEAFAAATRLPRQCAAARIDLVSCTWGRVNAVRVAHPLSAALPGLHAFLDMPTVHPPGAHDDAPRIQGPDFGASERFSVSPGHEKDAYLHMPGGASGHPLSPFYRAGFDAWAQGRPTPLLPGPAAHVLLLMP